MATPESVGATGPGAPRLPVPPSTALAVEPPVAPGTRARRSVTGLTDQATRICLRVRHGLGTEPQGKTGMRPNRTKAQRYTKTARTTAAPPCRSAYLTVRNRSRRSFRRRKCVASSCSRLDRRPCLQRPIFFIALRQRCLLGTIAIVTVFGGAVTVNRVEGQGSKVEDHTPRVDSF